MLFGDRQTIPPKLRGLKNRGPSMPTRRRRMTPRYPRVSRSATSFINRKMQGRPRKNSWGGGGAIRRRLQYVRATDQNAGGPDYYLLDYSQGNSVRRKKKKKLLPLGRHTSFGPHAARAPAPQRAGKQGTHAKSRLVPAAGDIIVGTKWVGGGLLPVSGTQRAIPKTPRHPAQGSPRQKRSFRKKNGQAAKPVPTLRSSHYKGSFRGGQAFSARMQANVWCNSCEWRVSKRILRLDLAQSLVMQAKGASCSTSFPLSATTTDLVGMMMRDSSGGNKGARLPRVEFRVVPIPGHHRRAGEQNSRWNYVVARALGAPRLEMALRASQVPRLQGGHRDCHDAGTHRFLGG